ncbi:MAG TPA: NAD-dependent epimerase/dehydratase family protein [Trebonia sp.]|nr:NAD-dependent epimerase/dehydratase family protein [Trebonia sp.]
MAVPQYVYVSTIGVFLPVTGPALTAGTPVGAGFGPYSRSKIAAERVARGCQQAGSPVVITYPAVVQGPHDPHVGDSVRFVRDLLRGRLPVLPRGRLSFVDVRDVGALHAAVLRPGPGCAPLPAGRPGRGGRRGGGVAGRAHRPPAAAADRPGLGDPAERPRGRPRAAPAPGAAASQRGTGGVAAQHRGRRRGR